jgi:hypothetical protein
VTTCARATTTSETGPSSCAFLFPHVLLGWPERKKQTIRRAWRTVRTDRNSEAIAAIVPVTREIERRAMVGWRQQSCARMLTGIGETRKGAGRAGFAIERGLAAVPVEAFYGQRIGAHADETYNLASPIFVTDVGFVIAYDRRDRGFMRAR